MDTKVCSKCKIEKPITEFYKNKLKSDGLQSECKECHNNRHQSYYSVNKEKRLEQKRKMRKEIHEYIVRIKSEEGCCICGLQDPACLDFHHIADKKDTVSNIMKNNSLRRVKNEIVKCVVICANCHRKLHYYNLSLEELKQLDRKQAAQRNEVWRAYNVTS